MAEHTTPLSAEQVEALAEAANKALARATHEDVCHCDGWPEACVSGYSAGYWDTGAFDTGVPAIVSLWESWRKAGASMPMPDFFRPGRTYETRDCSGHWLFRCEYVGVRPGTTEPAAHGWMRQDGGEWLPCQPKNGTAWKFGWWTPTEDGGPPAAPETAEPLAIRWDGVVTDTDADGQTIVCCRDSAGRPVALLLEAEQPEALSLALADPADLDDADPDLDEAAPGWEVEYAIRVPGEEHPLDPTTDEADAAARLARYRDCWPGAVLVERPVYRASWTEPEGGEVR